MSYGYHSDNISALDAMTEAQRIDFAPQLFQDAVNLRDYGILSFLDECGETGAPLNDIISAVDLNRYVVGILLDAGLSSRLVFLKNDHYFLTKTGHDLIHDRMTQVNINFTQDVCYRGMFHLNEALAQSKFAFPHFYSDSAVQAACLTSFSMVPGAV